MRSLSSIVSRVAITFTCVLIAGIVATSCAVEVPPTTIGDLDVDVATIPELQAAMDAGELTSEALVSFYLDRIDKLEPRLNAFITINFDAIEEARAADEARAAGESGPLLGIPVVVKDNIHTDGMPTTAGSLALAESMPPDAFIVERLRDAGAILLGKANLSEWAYMRGYPAPSGWSALGGQTINPYSLDRNPCGSSSGSAVAVAAALATAAIGTETDGSILCPAATNGIVGIKPSLGLISRNGIVPGTLQQDTPGPMARNVTDAAILLGVLASVDTADPLTADAADHIAEDYTAMLDARALDGARIGVWREGTFGIDARVDTVVEEAIDQIKMLGAEVVDPANLDTEGLEEAELKAMAAEFKRDINAYLAKLEGDLPKDLQGLIDFNLANAEAELALFGQELFEESQASPDADDPAILEMRQRAIDIARSAIDGTLAEHDLDAIVVASGGIAWELAPTDPNSGISTWGPAAVAGYPSVTVPAGYMDGLPVGVSFIGTQFGEQKLLGFAFALEQATDVRVPPTFANSLKVADPPTVN